MRDRQTEQPIELSGLLCTLYYVHDNDIYTKICKQISNQYSKEEIEKMHSAAQCAIDNPDYKFNAILPRTRQSNVDILHFLAKMKKLLWDFKNTQ